MTESREPALESRWKNGAIWPDNHGVHINAHGGHIVHFGNLWYWYGEHKIEGWEGRLAWHGVHAYSSPTCATGRIAESSSPSSTTPAVPFAEAAGSSGPKSSSAAKPASL